MNAKETMMLEVGKNLGFEAADRIDGVRQGVVHYLGDSEVCIITCVKDDEPYVRAIAEMHGDLTVRVIVRGEPLPKKRPPRGTGFGDRKWRHNAAHDNGIEVSFASKPDDEERTRLKEMGFRWSHVGGVWYLPRKKLTEMASCYLSHFAKADDV